MDWQEVAIGALSLLSGLGGWILKALWDAVSEMKRDLRLLENDIRTSFVRKDHLYEMFNDLKSTMIRIEQKLDTKADKLGPF